MDMYSCERMIHRRECRLVVNGLMLLGFMGTHHQVQSDEARSQPSSSTSLSAVFFNVSQAGVDVYEDQLLLYTLQGLVNRETPNLFFDTGSLDMDFPASDRLWVEYLTTHRNIHFNTSVAPNLCALVAHFQSTFDWGVVTYREDNYSSHLAATVAGIHGNLLPVSDAVMSRHTCLRHLEVREDLVAVARSTFTDKLAAYRWAIDTLLPLCDHEVLFNADNYFNAVPSQGHATLMSLDYPIAHKAFIMNLSPLWVCDPLDCGDPPHRVAMPKETELFVEIVSSSQELVSLFGWGDPEHAYTNITTHAGGVVFCTFSTPNLAFWSSLSTTLGTTPLPLPTHDNEHVLDDDQVYVIFETNEGDTPRILTSQFTSAWLSPNRGLLPVSWAVDPYVGKVFPELWNFFMANTTQNDTFVAGVDGGGYVFLDSLGDHATAYEERAGMLLKELGPNVVDVGVAQYGWPAVKMDKIQEYTNNAVKAGGVAPDLVLNACGSDWNESINTWLPNNGAVVVSSVCKGPVGNDTTNGHFLYYYRDHLSPTEPEADLAWRISWAAEKFKQEGRPLFLLVFGGLGLYGGHKDIFTFLAEVVRNLDSKTFVAVGAQEMARLVKDVKNV
eukprot:m.36176 g.36176  ORF g.36176 m.36176 type:complete len:612 (-) comp17272_c0_seq1:148-1983(-)